MILIENHIKDNGFIDKDKPCTCSYCKTTNTSKKLHYGLNIPKNWKAYNSWWVIKYAKGKYIRWTNSWLRNFAEKN